MVGVIGLDMMLIRLEGDEHPRPYFVEMNGRWTNPVKVAATVEKIGFKHWTSSKLKLHHSTFADVEQAFTIDGHNWTREKDGRQVIPMLLTARTRNLPDGTKEVLEAGETIRLVVASRNSVEDCELVIDHLRAKGLQIA